MNAAQMIVQRGKVQVVHQGLYRYIRMRVSRCGSTSADKLMRAFGGYYDDKKREWVASDKGTIKQVAEALIIHGCVPILRIGGLLLVYATSQAGRSTFAAQRIQDHTGRKTTHLEAYWWQQKWQTPPAPAEAEGV